MRPLPLKIILELNDTLKKYWNVGPQIGLFLHLLVKQLQPLNILEIGTSNGYSGIWIASALAENKKGHLYTIESHYKDRFLLAQKNFARAKLTQYITQICGHAPEIIPETPRYFDLIFLDATKYEHPAYLKAILTRLKKHSIIISDNTESHPEALATYMETVKKHPALLSQALKISKGLLISQYQD